MPAHASLEYLAHASFVVESPAGSRILIDPFASRVWLGYDFPGGIDPDVVLITHPHADHDGGRARGMPLPWAPTVPLIDSPGAYDVGDARVLAVEGRHADPYGTEFGQANTIMKIDAGGLSIVHLGDNGPLTSENVDALGSVDVLLAPIDSDFHILGADELNAVRAALTPRLLVPMHFRIPELEVDAESPAGLGELGPWLAIASQDQVIYVGASECDLAPEDWPDEEAILVFEHSSRVRRREV